jgi:N-acetylglucosaminyldiphosphoundecaprenol N-acetyl-beta-D-mannosaminyltransferase
VSVLLTDPMAGQGENFLGLKLHAVNLPQVSSRILRAVEEKERLTVTYLNPNYVVAAAKSARLAAAINEFDLVLADGIGVMFGARVLEIPVPGRLSTDRVCLGIFSECAKHGRKLKVFLFGGRAGIAEKAAQTLQAAYPTVEVVGTHHGWSGSAGDADIVERINSSRPDLLLVCLGTPRQQLWVSAHASRLQCPVIMTGGGYLDNLSVSVAYYPRWVDRMGLNWLWRLCTEPRHVWRRYTVEAVVFSGLLLKQLMRRRAEAVQ